MEKCCQSFWGKEHREKKAKDLGIWWQGYTTCVLEILESFDIVSNSKAEKRKDITAKELKAVCKTLLLKADLIKEKKDWRKHINIINVAGGKNL
jgi:hypothetical protein